MGVGLDSHKVYARRCLGWESAEWRGASGEEFRLESLFSAGWRRVSLTESRTRVVGYEMYGDLQQKTGENITAGVKDTDLHLREATIHKQFAAADVAAVVGCEKNNCL